MEKVGLYYIPLDYRYYGHLVHCMYIYIYYMAMRYLSDNLVYFPPFWYIQA
jgi:hypothetical protein